MTRAGNILRMVEAKKRYTINQLIKNAEKVQGNPLKQDRNIKISKITPYAGTEWVRFDASSTGEENKKYDLTMVFYDVDFSKEKDKQHPIDVKVKPKGRPAQIFYIEPLRTDRHPVAVYCGCIWFRFGCEWYLGNSLAPSRKRRPYKRKTTTRPPVNKYKIA